MNIERLTSDFEEKRKGEMLWRVWRLAVPAAPGAAYFFGGPTGPEWGVP